MVRCEWLQSELTIGLCVSCVFGVYLAVFRVCLVAFRRWLKEQGGQIFFVAAVYLPSECNLFWYRSGQRTIQTIPCFPIDVAGGESIDFKREGLDWLTA